MVATTVRPYPDEPADRPLSEWAAIAAVAAGAAAGDQQAWQALHRRFGPVIRGIAAGRFRLGPDDVQDVEQVVWLRIVTHLDAIDDLRCLPRWIAVTTRRECQRFLQHRSRREFPSETVADAVTGTVGDDPLEGAWRDTTVAAVQVAVLDLPERYRELAELLLDASEPTYQAIAAKLSLPLGSVGGTRQHLIAWLRRHAAIRRLAS